jgi:competence protein ComEC
MDSALEASFEKEVFETLNQMGRTAKPFRTYSGHKGLMIKSIWPDETVLLEPSVSENDMSEVLLIEYAGRKILLCGDIERTGQKLLIAHNPDLTVDVLVLPHHGSTTNLDAHFVESLKPTVVVASCSKRSVKNTYHPPEESSIHAFYTADDGAVKINITANGNLSTNRFITMSAN